jgi:hypothetical protein
MSLGCSSAWFTDARRAISRIASLREGWDGEGGPAPKRQAINAAAALLDEIKAYRKLPVPSVGPMIGGGLGIEWHYGPRELDVEVLPDGTIEYLKAERKATGFDVNKMQDGRIPADNLREVRKLVRWLIGC